MQSSQWKKQKAVVIKLKTDNDEKRTSRHLFLCTTSVSTKGVVSGGEKIDNKDKISLLVTVYESYSPFYLT